MFRRISLLVRSRATLLRQIRKLTKGSSKWRAFLEYGDLAPLCFWDVLLDTLFFAEIEGKAQPGLRTPKSITAHRGILFEVPDNSFFAFGVLGCCFLAPEALHSDGAACAGLHSRSTQRVPRKCSTADYVKFASRSDVITLCFLPDMGSRFSRNSLALTIRDLLFSRLPGKWSCGH